MNRGVSLIQRPAGVTRDEDRADMRVVLQIVLAGVAGALLAWGVSSCGSGENAGTVATQAKSAASSVTVDGRPETTPERETTRTRETAPPPKTVTETRTVTDEGKPPPEAKKTKTVTGPAASLTTVTN